MFLSQQPFLNLLPIFYLSGCGAENRDIIHNVQFEGLIPSYDPPPSDYEDLEIKDPNYRILETNYQDPYWVAALEMDEANRDISSILLSNNNEMKFAFPDRKPGYDFYSIVGWAPATENMKQASREIFENIGQVLKTSFIETDEISDNNVLVIARRVSL